MAEPSVSERAAALVEQLFEAPADPATWQRFFAALSAEIAEGGVAFLVGEVAPGGPTIIVGHGVELESVEPHEVQPSGPHPPADVAPVGKAALIPAGESAFSRSRLFQTVLSKRGVPPGPGLFLPLSRTREQLTGAVFVVSRDPDWRPRPDDVALLELLTPYIANAGSAGAELDRERTKASALLHALQRLRLGVILLDISNRIAFANESALEMLGIAAAGAPEDELYQHATAALSSLLRRETRGSSQSLQYPHPEDGRPLSIVLASLQWGDAMDAERRRFTTALFVSDPHGEGREAGASLRELYGLTPGEARMAEQLATGQTLAEAAEHLGIKRSTARGVLRSIFGKTGTHRQSSLVRLILSGPGRVREGPAGKRPRRARKKS